MLLKVHLGKATSLDEYFGLVFKAVKADENVPRCIAFIKRLLQMSYLNEANFTAATLLIISEIFKLRRDLSLSVYSINLSGAGAGNAAPAGQNSTTGAVKLDQNASDDDEEERFIDVDKLQEQAKVETKQEEKQKKQQENLYDPHKREPKFAKAENTQLYEIISLCHHSHPTVRLWAQNLLDNKPIEYKGDPILDFTIANFLDRISYKDPKSKEKLAKIKERQRMSDYEKPVNEYDFKNGERPETLREEEMFMYKYLQMRDKKKASEIVEGEDENGEVISDVEMEEFAEGEIEKEMKRLTSGAGGKTEYDDEDISFSDDGEEDATQDVAADKDGDADDQDSEDFFSDDEELEDVKLDGEEDSASEAEFGSQEDMGSDYGDEYDEEVQ